MHRISVVGASGSGKSTVAAALARQLQVRYVELDAIYHQPGWTPLPAEEFRSRLEPIVATDRWVVDGNYSVVPDLVWARADTVVWLDLPRPAVMRQLFARTAVRAISRRELWNGNREPITGMLRWHPERSILRWSWTTHGKVRRRYADAIRDPSNAHLAFVRLRSRSEITQWLADVGGS